jgi:all-beta uncharacterized protein/S-layer family protein
MSKRKAKHRKSQSVTLNIRRPLIAVLALLLSVVAVGGMLAQRQERKRPVAQQQPQVQPANVDAPTNLTAANLSKEYIYAGGRLVATEEPNSISPNLQSFPANGGTGSITVSVAAGQMWSVANNAPGFITITSGGGGGSGNGTINYTVLVNSTGANRTGTITITPAGFSGQTFTVYQGKSFPDVPENHPYYKEIGKLVARGVTLGYGNGDYGPSNPVPREQMATFIVRAIGMPNPPPPLSQRFNDVPPSNIFYAFIEQIAVLNITVGCSSSPPLYCPSSNVTHEQMSALILKATGSINPPTPQSPTYNDVQPGHLFYSFIGEYYVRDIWRGGFEDWTDVLPVEARCTPGNFCPAKNVTRAQMAKILVKAFNL